MGGVRGFMWGGGAGVGHRVGGRAWALGSWGPCAPAGSRVVRVGRRRFGWCEYAIVGYVPYQGMCVRLPY
eukprot:3015963-Prymnesium_polylepis.1